MSDTEMPTAHGHAKPAGRAYQLFTALSMTIGRGTTARSVADLAELTTRDRVLDIGCGPGTAVRLAAHRCADATGVDPSPVTLRLARWITSFRRIRNVTWVKATAESLPVPPASATVVWALSSLHHWTDRAAGLHEAHRVLTPGGTVLIVERLVTPDAKGHARHGLTHDQLEALAPELTTAGFTQVHTQMRPARRRTLAIAYGRRAP